MKNYIEEAMKNINLKVNQEFTFDDFEHICWINEFFELECKTLSTAQRDALLLGIMIGKRIPILIKPKTLMGQLKEQGFGYFIMSDGYIEILLTDETSDYFEQCLKMGGIFLTQSEAEREVYRRKLEFEMQEWSRENDCLSTSSPHLDCQIFKMFNVYVRTFDDELKAKSIFNKKAGKYYDWEG